MKALEFGISNGDEVIKDLDADRLLVVLSSSSKQTSFFVEKLKKQSVPTLSTEHDYLKIHMGLLENSRVGFFLVEWAFQGNHSLERRWLLNKISERMRTGTSAKHLVIYLDQGWKSEQLVQAEDLYFANTDALDLTSKFESFKILAHPEGNLKSSDPYREQRFSGCHDYRLWVAENPDELTSIEIGNRLRAFAAQSGCSFEEFGIKELSELGMNLLLAVGQASERSPSRMYLVGHRLSKNSKPPLVLVGKGITFDTGGINLKPHEGFVNAMKNDMGGAALTAQLFMRLVESGFDEPMLLVIPTCENLIGEKSMKPGAVVRSFAGKKVMIEHTDAEGRLILADALSYVDQRFKPRMIISAATLTTAALRQFSHFFTAVHFASESQQKELVAAGQQWGEAFSCWNEFLPFSHGNDSLAADLTNMGRLPHHASIGGGSNVAAHFLKKFCTSPYVHFDIFATVWNWGGDYPGSYFGATGAPFNSLFYLLRDRSTFYQG